MHLKVAFRADASLQIGTGHVMRCLTLADALTASRGADCEFICRAHDGNLIEVIREKGHRAHVLTAAAPEEEGLTAMQQHARAAGSVYGHWLGASQDQDAGACAPILTRLRPDWLIVDHYALDADWERALAPHYQKLMVIDDLADREHVCDLLLDQTLGRTPTHYHSLVPSTCRLLCGSQFALLRPEFATLRPYSLKRRAQPEVRELLIAMGGIDKDNVTGQVLEVLRACPRLPADCRITVVMGVSAPWLSEVRSLAHEMHWQTRVLAGVRDMAQLMADSDLAIGAAGSTTWERCCLGLPTIMIVVADNQRHIAHAICNAGAAHLVDAMDLRNQPLITVDILNPRVLSAMSTAAAAISDGLGAIQVIKRLTD